MTGREAIRGAFALGCAFVAAAPAAWGATSASSLPEAVAVAVAAAEYELAPRSGGGHAAPNRAQGLRTTWREGRVQVQPRVVAGQGSAEAWGFALELRRFGRGDNLRAAPRVRSARSLGNRLEWERADVVEWYVNDERGVEQGFTLERRPPGRGDDVVLEMRLEGLAAGVAQGGGRAELLDSSGAPRLFVSGLVVTDATGRELRARFDGGGSQLRIVFDDSDAQYPCVVDPLLSTSSWRLPILEVYYLGMTVTTAGDVNGDGHADLVVMAPDGTGAVEPYPRIQVFHGSAVGLSLTPATVMTALQTGWNPQGVATAGDVDADGFDDLVVGITYSGPEIDEGAALIFRGSPAGILPVPSWQLEANEPDALLGHAVAGVGDVNGDGYDDVLVGAPGQIGSPADEGRAHVFFGSASGPATSPSWSTSGGPGVTRLGGSVGAAGDVDGDGYADLVLGVGAFPPWRGQARLHRGSATGPSAVADWIVDGDQPVGQFGSAIGTAGDVNGDGFADVIVGSMFRTQVHDVEGAAFLYLGSATGLALSPAWRADGGYEGRVLGFTVGTAGDVDADGFADVLVAARDSTAWPGPYVRGEMYRGSASGLPAAPDWRPAAHDNFCCEEGWRLVAAGDVDGDGFSDVVLGKPEDGTLAAEVFHGGGGGLAPVAAWSSQPDQAGALLGSAVAWAGDVNGDGYADVIVGAPDFDGGLLDEGRAFAFHGGPGGLGATPSWTASGGQAGARFGAALATAGDSDADGFADVLVGAPGWDEAGMADAGRILLYRGSAAGLLATPGWAVEGTSAGDGLGSSVASADVNGDGLVDILGTAAGTGSAWAYPGTPLGASAGPSACDAIELDPGGGCAGAMVISLGDVDGDGIDDVMLVQPPCGASSGGNIRTLHGSLDSFSLSEPDGVLDGLETGPNPGAFAAGVGDFDGDGYDDMVVGEPEWNGGRVSWYRGSPGGIVTPAAFVFEGTQQGERLGESVAGVGDVDLDGLDDVVAGAPNYDELSQDQGRVLLFLHAGAAPSTISVGEQAGDRLGAVLAAAGDVDADGFADVLAGAPSASRGHASEGLALLFNGSLRSGLARRVRAVRVDTSLLLPPAATTPAAGFGALAKGRSPFGREPVRLEWEVERVPRPFDGAGVRVGPWVDTGLPGLDGSVAALAEWHAPFPRPGRYRWRVRVRADSLIPWVSPWVALPLQAKIVLAADDLDGDGVPDFEDNAPADPNPGQEDDDGDGLGNVADPFPLDPGNDADCDGVPESLDPCPLDADDDLDGDGLCGDVDNCPALANPAQDDADGDGRGDLCDPCVLDPLDDQDADGACADVDPCPADPLDDQDADGACADVDNCPDLGNPLQQDLDGDGRGDDCDPCPLDAADDADGDGACADVDPCDADVDDDGDADGLCADVDNCVDQPNPLQDDEDLDGVGDACDPCPDDVINDVDGDGSCFGDDPCPWDAADDADGDGACGDIDNCPDDDNPSQADGDSDGLGDACDWCPGGPQRDWDFDGVCDSADNCPLVPNADQLDGDGDLVGDACDPCLTGPGADGDLDGACDSADNCPLVPNADQLDGDGNLVGDACDWCQTGPQLDADRDAICDSSDNCPNEANLDQADDDLDGVGDACDPCLTGPQVDGDLDGVCDSSDNCPLVPNADQLDGDGDLVGDACDPCLTGPQVDGDLDGVCDSADNCPLVPNADQDDGDGDLVGDACDPCLTGPQVDGDLDGVCDSADNCPLVPNADQDDGDGDLVGDACDPCLTGPQVDGDLDGVCDSADNCPLVPNADQDDGDGDLVGDACDPCPDVPGVVCSPIAFLRNAELTGRDTAELSSVLTAGRDPALDPVRDLHLADVSGMPLLALNGDAALVGRGQPGVLILYEAAGTPGPIHVRRSGQQVVVSGW